MGRTTTFHGYKTRVGYGDFSAIPTSLAGATYLGELKSVTRNGEAIAKLDATHLESPDGYKELIPGFGEGGTFELTFNYTPYLERLLDGLSPNPSLDPVAGGAAVSDPPAYGRRMIYLSDRYGNFNYARAIWDPPSRTVADDGTQTMTVSVTVAEGRVKYIAAAGAAANPGTYANPT
jgi:hypothetical protein